MEKYRTLNFIIGILICNIVFYLIGSFVALNWNPTQWEMMRDAGGRYFFSLLELGCIIFFLTCHIKFLNND